MVSLSPAFEAVRLEGVNGDSYLLLTIEISPYPCENLRWTRILTLFI